MNIHRLTSLMLAFISLWIIAPQLVHAEPPKLQTPNPVIYLADNLDEQDKLGWCIDTVGRGFSDRLHAHSCKPQGGDVQFTYKKATRQIMSATFANKCAELPKSAKVGATLRLLDCSAMTVQQFDYDRATSEFRPVGNSSLCLVAGAASRSAGPFMSRNLELANCSATAAKFKQWRIKDNGS